MLTVLLLLSCKPDPDPAVTAEEPSSCGSWSSVGQPLMLTWCAACHSSTSEGTSRHGAPVGVDLETLSGVQTHLDRVRVRAVEQQDMPSGGGLSEADLVRLQAWLSCGAPGEEAPFPAVGSAPDDDLSSGDVDVRVSPGKGAGVRVILRELSGQAVMQESFLVDGGGVYFSSYTLTGELGAGRSVRFNTPLPLTEEGEWSGVVEVNRDGDRADEEWTVYRDDTLLVDGRGEDPEAAAVVALSADGEEHQWFLSQTHVVGARRLWVDGLSAEFLRLDAFVPSKEDVISPFPPEQGDMWAESVLFGEVAPWWD
ncbi:MAG: hypothetical protein ACI8S6_005107 [Myxococcota bacterium]|jgi:hypothetical protein